MNRGRGIGPRGVITIGGLPEGTPTGGCKVGTGGGGSVGLSWGLGVGILAEEDGEQMPAVSEGEVAEEVEGAKAEVADGPPGETKSDDAHHHPVHPQPVKRPLSSPAQTGSSTATEGECVCVCVCKYREGWGV